MQGLVGAEWEFGWEMNLVILASLLLLFSQAPHAPGWGVWAGPPQHRTHPGQCQSVLSSCLSEIPSPGMSGS